TRPAHYECAALPTELFQHRYEFMTTGTAQRIPHVLYHFIIPQILRLSRGFKKILRKIKKTIEIAGKMCYNDRVL
ncbi:MAG: hypothetical protein ACLT3J_02265, partial [Ruminococcus sp.]